MGITVYVSVAASRTISEI